MAKCKYPNEVCANKTVLKGVMYCDSVPCSLKNELPKQTNADRIRNMTNEELTELLVWGATFHPKIEAPDCSEECKDYCPGCITKCSKEKQERAVRKWLESECDVE